jgi:hypothetical protein
MNDPADHRLKELLDLAIERTCSDADRKELAQFVEKNPRKWREIINQLFVHSLLQWQTEDIGEDLRAQPATASDTQRTHGPVGSTQRHTGRLWLAAAAVLLCAGSYAGWQIFQSPFTQDDLVGEIAENRGVVWSNRCSALKDGHGIVPGRLEMKAGTLAIRFRSGATLSVTGRTSMRIESDMHVELDDGQATAYVPQWA